jgi:hypothetical protein
LFVNFFLTVTVLLEILLQPFRAPSPVVSAISFSCEFMRNQKVTRLRVSPEVSEQLHQLGLSTADLDVLVCFGRKLRLDDKTLYILDSQAPGPIRTQFGYLLDVYLIVISGEIVGISRDSK